MSELDLARIKRNVAKMASAGAPEQDIDGYIASEGTTVEAIRAFKPQATQPEKTLGGSVIAGLKAAGAGAIGTISEFIDPTPLAGERVSSPIKPDLTATKQAAREVVTAQRGKYKDTLAGQGLGYATEILANPANALIGGKATTAVQAAPTLTKIGYNALLGGAGGFLSGVGEDDSRIANMATGAAVGGALTAAGAGVKKAAGAVGGGSKAVAKAVSIDQTAASELAKQNIDVSRATAGSDTAKGYVRNILSETFFGGKTVKDAATRVDEQIEKALSDSIGKIGKASDFFTTGQQVRASVDAARDAFKKEAARLYDQADGLINKDALADGKNILRLVPELTSDLQQSQAVQAVRGVASEADDLLRAVATAVNDESKAGTFTVGRLMQMRRDVGEKIADVPFSDARQGALKRLYGAISSDLDAVLDNKTTNLVWDKTNAPQAEEALRAYKAANRFYKEGITQLKAIEKRFGGARSEEQVFTAVTSATKQDTRRAALLLDKMSPSARKNLQASILTRMALKQGGQDLSEASVQTFVNNWKKMAPRSKALIAGDSVEQFDLLARNYERVAPLINSLPENGLKGAANLLDKGTAIGVAFGALTNPSIALAGVLKFASDKVFANLLTKPQTAKAINAAMAKNTPQAAAAAINKLAQYEADKGVKAQLQAIAKQIAKNTAIQGSVRAIENAKKN